MLFYFFRVIKDFMIQGGDFVNVCTSIFLLYFSYVVQYATVPKGSCLFTGSVGSLLRYWRFPCSIAAILLQQTVMYLKINLQSWVNLPSPSQNTSSPKKNGSTGRGFSNLQQCFFFTLLSFSCPPKHETLRISVSFVERDLEYRTKHLVQGIV